MSAFRLRALISTATLLASIASVAYAGDEKPSAPRPTFTATRAAKAPVIDADLSDEAWSSAQEITGFTQHDPDDGKPATQKTVVKVVYDNDAIYFGAMMYDTNPVTTLLGRRDNGLESDWLRILIDSQHDGLSGAEFNLNPSNVQQDGILYNDIYDDTTWDAVWASQTKITKDGWIAEVRIPYSQLRFPEKPVQTWGINFVRKINKNSEADRLVNTPKGENGFVSRFANLTGIEGIKPERAFEVMPYGVARSDLNSRIDNANPFATSYESKMDGGVDVKYGLSSNLTLTGTINPDFGQVEVDPAVVNLSQFETFFPERRPFFTEGTQMFKYGSGPAHSRWNFNLFGAQFFYSRRIGRSPQGTGNVDADYIDAPGETTILGAGKITGKFGDGWSIGVLDAITNRERATYVLGSTRQQQQVEPMTNYLVARGAKEFDKGNSRLGFLFTGVNRNLPDELTYLRKDAYFAGIDGYTLFHKKDWLFEWNAGASRVDGSAEAIAITQRGAAHYYQRPDATHVEYDPTRTSLTGTAIRAMLGKQTGKWRPNIQVQSYSPGLEVNDVGFMPRADVIATHAVMQFVDEDPKKYTRSYDWWLGKYQNWNQGGDLIADGVFGNWYVQWKNYWYNYGWGGFDNAVLDDRKTRGGPLAQRPGSWDAGVGWGSDSRKKFSFETNIENYSADDGGYSRSMWVNLNYRPSSNIRLSLSPSFRREHDPAQYVDTTDRAIFSAIEQRTLDIGTRVEWTVNSRLSFQLFTQPFIATGAYHDFLELARARTADYAPAAYDSNPDFNFRSVRGSAVVRWEFRPGSAVYFVWNENRSDTVSTGDFRLRRDLGSIRHAPSRDVFLIKVSYWLPI
jgi:hypothetical protein